MPTVSKKHILITGASAEIGHHIALALSPNVANLALHYHQNETAVTATQHQLLQAGCTPLLLQYDLTQPSAAQAMIAETIATFGHLDALINVVGPFVYEDINDVTPESWERTIALNLHTCFNVIHYAKPHLIASHGHIVNFAFSGVENIKSWSMSTAYCAAKTGIAVLTKSLATALAPHGVRVNAICPGLVEETTATAAERQTMAAQIPIGRPIRPQEVANTVEWLVNKSPEGMTGSLIAVSGGWEY